MRPGFMPWGLLTRAAATGTLGEADRFPGA
jgi:hypothetical protein